MKISTANAIFTTYPNREWVVDFNTGDNGEPDSTLDAVPPYSFVLRDAT